MRIFHFTPAAGRHKIWRSQVRTCVKTVKYSFPPPPPQFNSFELKEYYLNIHTQLLVAGG